MQETQQQQEEEICPMEFLKNSYNEFHSAYEYDAEKVHEMYLEYCLDNDIKPVLTIKDFVNAVEEAIFEEQTSCNGGFCHGCNDCKL